MTDEAEVVPAVALHRDDIAGVAAVTGGRQFRETTAPLDGDLPHEVPADVRELAVVIAEARMRGIRFGPYTLARAILDAGYRRERTP